MMCGVPEVTDVDKPYEDTNDGDDLGEHLTEIVELTLQRRFLANLRRDGLVDITNSSLLASERDDGNTLPVDNGGTLRSELWG